MEEWGRAGRARGEVVVHAARRGLGAAEHAKKRASKRSEQRQAKRGDGRCGMRLLHGQVRRVTCHTALHHSSQRKLAAAPRQRPRIRNNTMVLPARSAAAGGTRKGASIMLHDVK